ncbi:hypothetical protein P3T37_004336 [Kitasatospora sp. MAA4]|uniref:hypothetical protein n=1 Tax=Kitasatospora sp. MAA4 TaxID=3035093 RepID=UPI002475468A|nr:hypothetical protein [Kitasatospora sp. MAA4]MDH6134927.1 hypothetical protein [Kitasatospora sp. MAA4]
MPIPFRRAGTAELADPIDQPPESAVTVACGACGGPTEWTASQQDSNRRFDLPTRIDGISVTWMLCPLCSALQQAGLPDLDALADVISNVLRGDEAQELRALLERLAGDPTGPGADLIGFRAATAHHPAVVCYFHAAAPLAEPTHPPHPRGRWGHIDSGALRSTVVTDLRQAEYLRTPTVSPDAGRGCSVCGRSHARPREWVADPNGTSRCAPCAERDQRADELTDKRNADNPTGPIALQQETRRDMAAWTCAGQSGEPPAGFAAAVGWWPASADPQRQAQPAGRLCGAWAYLGSNRRHLQEALRRGREEREAAARAAAETDTPTPTAPPRTIDVTSAFEIGRDHR